MRVNLENDELVDVTVKQGNEKNKFEYYVGSIKIGVLDEGIMEDNILQVDSKNTNPKLCQKIVDAINELPREEIVQDVRENEDIEELINEKYGDIQIEKDIRKINLDEELKYPIILDDVEIEKIEKQNPKNKVEKNKQNAENEANKDKQNKDEKEENEEKIKTKETAKAGENKVEIKQSVELDERANDVKSLRSWLGGTIPPDFDRIGVVESEDVRKYGSKNSTRYSLVLIKKDGTVELAEKYLPQLHQRDSSGNSPRENYQVRTNEDVEKDAVLSEYELGNKIVQIDNKEHGRLSVNIGKESRSTNEVISQELRGENTTFVTSKEQRSVIGEYEENGEYTVEEDLKEAKEHEEMDDDCGKMKVEDIDGDPNTKTHTHIKDEDKIVLEDGTEITFKQLATRWGLYDDHGMPDEKHAKDKYEEKQTEDSEKNADQIVDELDEEYEDPRAPEERRI